jgi:hypothetical protein
MKNILSIFFLTALTVGLVSCESDVEKYSGTPVGNQNIETLHATIELINPAQTAFLTSQKIPFRVILPRTFSDTVTVEATSLNKSGGRTRTYVDIMPGETMSNPDNIADKDPVLLSAGGVVFNTEMDIYLSAIALQTVEPGKHYLLDSNRITLNTGSTSVPTDDAAKLQVKFAWYNPGLDRNYLKVLVDRPNLNTPYVSQVNSVTQVGTNPNTATAIVYVNSTAGLQKGMTVQVSSGIGAFFNNTVVTSVGLNSFTTSTAPTLAFGSVTEITATGPDYTGQVTSASGTTINVNSTAGLYPGMVLGVASGPGTFGRVATVSSITSATAFKVTPSASGLNSTSVISATYADVYPNLPYNGSSILHDFTTETGVTTVSFSSAEGEYFFKFVPNNVIQDGADIPYRIVWKYPDGTADFYDGVYHSVGLTSAPLSVLKVTKTGSGTAASFTVTPL